MGSDMESFFHAHNLTVNFNITGMEIENDLQVIATVLDIQRHHWTLSIWASLLYVAVIFMIKKLMVNNARLDLSKPLAVWSGVLAIFSVMGTVRMAPSLYFSLRYESFHHSVCSFQWERIPVLALWSGLFSMSKLFELGDTVFIVLKKSPLLFLHWYHHVTVVTYTWYGQYDRASSCRWFTVMNYAVHSVMYSYYACRALRYKMPNWIKICITVCQISQMVMGCFICIYIHYLKHFSIPCQVSTTNLQLSSALYLSYLALFLKFFCDTYINCSKTDKAQQASIPSNRTGAAQNGQLDEQTNGNHGNNKKDQ